MFWHTFDPEIKYEPLKIHLARSLPNFCQISLVNGLCKDKNLCVQPIKSVPNKMWVTLANANWAPKVKGFSQGVHAAYT